MSTDNTQQKFWGAVLALVSTGTIQERLRFAAIELAVWPQRHNAFHDPQLQARFDTVIDRLTCVQDDDEGSIAATTRALSDEDADDIAAEIARLFRAAFEGVTA